MDVPTLIIAGIGLLFTMSAALVGDSGLLAFLSRADVRYIRTHVLKRSSEYIHGIILVNRGGKLARDIVVRIDCDDTITDLQTEDDKFQIKPSISEGGVGNDFVVLRLERLIPKSNGTIYITTRKKIIPRASVSYDNGVGLEESHEYKRPLSDKIVIFIGISALFWILIGAIFGL